MRRPAPGASVHAFAQTEIFGILFLGYGFVPVLCFGLVSGGARSSPPTAEAVLSRERASSSTIGCSGNARDCVMGAAINEASEC